MPIGPIGSDSVDRIDRAHKADRAVSTPLLLYSSTRKKTVNCLVEVPKSMPLHLAIGIAIVETLMS